MASRRGRGEGSIRLRDDGRWEATLALPTLDGRRRRKSFFARTKAEAARLLREGQAKVDGNVPIEGGRETLGRFLDVWLRDSAQPNLRPRTFASYQMIVDRHIKPSLGKIVLAKLGPVDVARYMKSKRAGGLSARTVQYHHAVLRRALTQAEQWGKVARNVARLAPPPKVERPEVRPLSPEQALLLLGAIAESRDGPLFAVALGLGLRQGEVLGLQWTDVDFAAGELAVRHTLQRYGGAYHLDPPKTARSRRTLGLPAGLLEVLRAHRYQQLQERLKAGPAWQGDAWNLVFMTELGAPRSGSPLTHQFQDILERLGLPRQRFHDLRHAAATFMVAQGIDLRVVMEVLGHAQINTTANTYAHVRVDATRLAAESIEALFKR